MAMTSDPATFSSRNRSVQKSEHEVSYMSARANTSFDFAVSARKKTPNFDIDEIIKNPNSNVKKKVIQNNKKLKEFRTLPAIKTSE